MSSWIFSLDEAKSPSAITSEVTAKRSFRRPEKKRYRRPNRGKEGTVI